MRSPEKASRVVGQHPLPLEVDDSGSVDTVDPVCPMEWLPPAVLGCFASTEKTVRWVYPTWAFPDRCDEKAEEYESLDYRQSGC